MTVSLAAVLVKMPSDRLLVLAAGKRFKPACKKAEYEPASNIFSPGFIVYGMYLPRTTVIARAARDRKKA